jgi:hypothetical protein
MATTLAKIKTTAKATRKTIIVVAGYNKRDRRGGGSAMSGMSRAAKWRQLLRSDKIEL